MISTRIISIRSEEDHHGQSTAGFASAHMIRTLRSREVPTGKICEGGLKSFFRGGSQGHFIYGTDMQYSDY